MLFKKNIGLGKTKFNLFIYLFLIIPFFAYSEQNQEGSYTNIKILDKISSKNILIKLKNGEAKKHKDLLIKSKKRLRSIGIYNISYLHDDGWNGWKKYGPYDGIIVTAAAAEVPEKLMQQLAINGTLVMPMGPEGKQELINVKRCKEKLSTRSLAQ